MNSSPHIPWKGPHRGDWLEEVRAWIDETVRNQGGQIVGDVEFIRDRAWSAVVRAHVTDRPEPVYFKACGHGGRHEPAVVEFLSHHFPDRIAKPLAVDVDRAWMLMPDYGKTLRDHLKGDDAIPFWHDILKHYAEIQIAMQSHVDQFIRMGVPDRRLAVLPKLVEDLIRDDVAMRVGLPDGLADEERDVMLDRLTYLEASIALLGLATPYESIEHGDLHDGNVLVNDTGFKIFDWGDVSLTHPFCSMLVTANMTVGGVCSDDEWERTKILCRPFLRRWVPDSRSLLTLEAAMSHAIWVGHTIRALDWHHMLQGADEDSHAQWDSRVVLWMRLWAERFKIART